MQLLPVLKYNYSESSSDDAVMTEKQNTETQSCEHGCHDCEGAWKANSGEEELATLPEAQPPLCLISSGPAAATLQSVSVATYLTVAVYQQRSFPCHEFSEVGHHLVELVM